MILCVQFINNPVAGKRTLQIMELYCFLILLLGMYFITVCLDVKTTTGADIKYMEDSLRSYFAEVRHHDVDMVYKNRSMYFIHDEFKRFGMEAVYHEFQDLRVSDKMNFTNVVGILKGERFGNISDRILGVGAHFDTVDTTPGVDDNGAGCAAMLEIARQLTSKGIKRQNTILFIGFDVEERTTFASGSENFVSGWLFPFLEENYGPDYKTMEPYGVVVMDVPMEYNTSEYSQIPFADQGYDKEFAEYFPTTYANMEADNFRGDFIALSYRNGSGDMELANTFLADWDKAGRAKFEIETFPLPVQDVSTIEAHPVLKHWLRSDHTPFWLADFPAIFLTDTAPARGDGMACYHNPCDSIDVMITEDNMNFLGKTADTVAQSLHSLSEPHKSTSGAVANYSSFLLLVVLGIIYVIVSN